MNLELHGQERNKLILANLEFLKDKAFVEFGVCHGGSFKNFYELYKQHELPINFMGFDSFLGIPEEKNDPNSIWYEGQFDRRGVSPRNGPSNWADLQHGIGAPIEDVQIIDGWFKDTLNETSAQLLGQKIGIAHIDCDTYTSTLECWQWMIENDLLVNGSLIIYDDWGAHLEANCEPHEVGEGKAHYEIAKKTTFEDLGMYIIDSSFYEVKMFRVIK
jgi:hypothetical protein